MGSAPLKARTCKRVNDAGFRDESTSRGCGRPFASRFAVSVNTHTFNALSLGHSDTHPRYAGTLLAVVSTISAPFMRD